MLIIGTSSSEALDGSADPDEIDGEDGDDSLYGHGGDDILYGDEGDDKLAGGDGNDSLDGGEGDDVLWGGGGSDQVIFRDGYGHDVIMDFDVTDGSVALVSSGVTYWEDVQARLTADVDGMALLTLDDGSTLRFEGLRVEDLRQDHFNLPNAPICLALGTRVTTARGAVAVENLQAGDLVQTLDQGLQPILWVGRKRTVFGHGSHQHQPIVIRAGSMGSGLPLTDLRVSPQHRILVHGPKGRRFDKGGLAKAKGLCTVPGIDQDKNCTSVEYFQLLLPDHALILANGLPVETFLPRAFAMASLDTDARNGVLRHFPGLADDPDTAYGPSVRPILSMKLIASLPPSALQTLAPVAASVAA